MSISKTIILTSILGSAILPWGFVSASAQEDKKFETNIEIEASQVSLVAFLTELGDLYGAYFTIEQVWEETEPTNRLISYPVPAKFEKTGLQQNLENLRAVIPNFDYLSNKSNPKIVHIIDGRSNRLDDYSLNMTLESIKFQGTVSELIKEINRRGINISLQTVFLLSDLKYMDISTMISVDGTNIETRDLLSVFIPLEKYNRVIWTATTRLNKKESTKIIYYGRKKER